MDADLGDRPRDLDCAMDGKDGFEREPRSDFERESVRTALPFIGLPSRIEVSVEGAGPSNVPAPANAGPRAFATTAKAPDSAWPGNFGEGANADTFFRSPNGRSRDCVVPSGQKRRH